MDLQLLSKEGWVVEVVGASGRLCVVGEGQKRQAETVRSNSHFLAPTDLVGFPSCLKRL